MFGGNVICAFQIGNGTRHFEYAVVGARGEAEARNGLLQQRGALFVRRAQRINFGYAKLRVGLVLAGELDEEHGGCVAPRTGFVVELISQDEEPYASDAMNEP